MPLKTRSIKVKLNGFVKYVHSTKVGNAGRQFVSIDKTFNINKMEDTYKFGSFYLNKCENNEYFISLLGKNGEVIPNILCDVQLSHSYFKNKFTFTLKTDKNGNLHIPHYNLLGMTNISVSPKTERGIQITSRNQWQINTNNNYYNDIYTYYMNENNPLFIPLNINNNNIIKHTNYCLFDSLYADKFEKQCIEITDKGYLKISNIKHGEYILSSFNSNVPNCRIIVLPVTNNTIGEETKHDIDENMKTEIDSNSLNLSLLDKYYMQLSTLIPLQITEINGSIKKGFKIKLNGYTNLTRVHVMFTHFYTQFSGFKTFPNSSLMNGQFDEIMKCKYTNKRKINQEYKYCLDRKTRKKYNNCFISKPSFLVKPLERRDIFISVNKPKPGSIWEETIIPQMEFEPPYEEYNAPLESKNPFLFIEDSAFGNFDFLKNTSKLLFNLLPDKNGFVSIDNKYINNSLYNMMYIIAVNDIESQCKEYCLNESVYDIDIKYRDNRQIIKEINTDKIILK
eukprot:493323_1